VSGEGLEKYYTCDIVGGSAISGGIINFC